MASRAFSRRLLSSALRAPARPAGRRFASTSSGHGAKQSSDTPWMIGSALVFGPIAAYLLTSQGKDKGKHAADAHHGKAAKAHAPSEELEPAKDEQPAEQSEQEPASESSDGKLHGAPAMTDSEGTTASAEEINASMKQAFRAEEQDDKFSQGAPGQTEEAETKPDQKEKPGKSHTGTLQSDEDSGPTNLGDAREQAKSEKAPKEAAQD
ncbi:hypothetical protein ONZ51_g9604 [Trametes cubensis]|uniref:Uncharacterized protein n=1 Tax=Trametes cubensis TaxID=1111947 RepID=A0AAD7TNK9_9APHY|nr:hypothetical protein ONZ51_g9604 [Trametes cubensis]